MSNIPYGSKKEYGKIDSGISSRSGENGPHKTNIKPLWNVTDQEKPLKLYDWHPNRENVTMKIEQSSWQTRKSTGYRGFRHTYPPYMIE